jgi:hypothetical protein
VLYSFRVLGSVILRRIDGARARLAGGNHDRLDPGSRPADALVDGDDSTYANTRIGTSDGTSNWELALSSRRTVAAVRVALGTSSFAVRAYRIEAWDGASWNPVPGAAATGLSPGVVHAATYRVEPMVSTDSLRLVILASHPYGSYYRRYSHVVRTFEAQEEGP